MILNVLQHNLEEGKLPEATEQLMEDLNAIDGEGIV